MCNLIPMSLYNKSVSIKAFRLSFIVEDQGLSKLKSTLLDEISMPITRTSSTARPLTKQFHSEISMNADFGQSDPLPRFKLNRSCTSISKDFDSAHNAAFLLHTLRESELCGKRTAASLYRCLFSKPLLLSIRLCSYNAQAWADTIPPWSSLYTMILPKLQDVTAMLQLLIWQGNGRVMYLVCLNPISIYLLVEAECATRLFRVQITILSACSTAFNLQPWRP